MGFVAALLAGSLFGILECPWMTFQTFQIQHGSFLFSKVFNFFLKQLFYLNLFLAVFYCKIKATVKVGYTRNFPYEHAGIFAESGSQSRAFLFKLHTANP